mmetsp:Transcript_35860/g.55934  ORF Transcript_35860/g.55934 Transcript_35860/m.55934 type:complete len:105 (+) Transcript_35860:23-337(+)
MQQAKALIVPDKVRYDEAWQQILMQDWNPYLQKLTKLKAIAAGLNAVAPAPARQFTRYRFDGQTIPSLDESTHSGVSFPRTVSQFYSMGLTRFEKLLPAHTLGY